MFVILIWNGSLTALMSGAKHRIDRDFHERIRCDVLRIEEATAELTPLASGPTKRTDMVPCAIVVFKHGDHRCRVSSYPG